MWPSNGRAPRGSSSKQSQGRRGQASPPPKPPPGGYRILVLVGIPGSGKSTFASFLEDLGWTAVSQDALGSRDKCRSRAKEVLRRGGRVIIDRCNFDKAQRVTWIDLAISLSLHKDACIAVWLDIDLGVCQERVRGRVGHPTLGPGRAAAGIVRRVAGQLRPPHLKEGFHAVLRCKGDQQSLSDAVALLSSFRDGHDTSGGGGGEPPAAIGRASSAPEMGAVGCVSGNDWIGGFGGARAAWGQPPLHARDEAGPVGGAIPASYSRPEPFTADRHMTPGGAEEQWFPVDAGYHPAAAAAAAYNAAGIPMPQGGELPARPVSAWGGGGQQNGGSAGAAAHMRDALSGAVEPDASSYPSLPGAGGGGASRGRNSRRFNGSIGKPSPQPPPPRTSYRSSSLSSIAKLTPRGQAAASSAARQSPQKTTTAAAQAQTQTRLLTPAEISANFSDLQAPPRLITPEDVVMPESKRKRGPGVKSSKSGANGSSAAPPVPLAPSSLEDWTSLSALSATDGGSSQRPRGAVEAAELASAVFSAGADGAGVGGASVGSATTTGENLEDEDVGLTEGETFFVLEDMFGGLLLPEVLERVFRESGNNLEKAVKEVTRLFEDTPADSYQPPSTRTSSETNLSSSNDAYSETWEAESDGEFMDVSDWTHKQAETLTDLCLAFGEAFPRERIIAALTASGHDATGAAQLLLDEDFQARQRREAVAAGTGPRRAESGGGGGRRRRNRRFPGGRAAAQLDRKQLLGATCGGDRKAGVHGEEEGESGEEQEEEEEGDEGLSSEEYRALANEAAEEMKAWFQKAAEAYTKGGRNGGAAAADPSQKGQRWKKKMEATNLRAAREVFRERNPLVRVGYTTDNVSVLKVLALPRPSRCPTPGRLSVDLHLLRRMEALSVLDAVLLALARHRGRARRQDPNDAPAGGQRRPDSAPSVGASDSFSVAAAAAGSGARPSSAGDPDAAATVAAAHAHQIGPPAEEAAGVGRPLYNERFSSLEVVVGRGTHSVAGVARLKPCVAAHLARKRLPAQAVQGDRGEGVVVVGLEGL